MYKPSDFRQSYYKAGEVADILGVTTRTVQNYDRAGKLVFHRGGAGRRLCSREALLDYLNRHGMLAEDTRNDVIYLWDEVKQSSELASEAVGIVNSITSTKAQLNSPVTLTETGNEKFEKLVPLIMKGNVRDIYTNGVSLTSEERRWLSIVCREKNCGLVIVDERLV